MRAILSIPLFLYLLVAANLVMLSGAENASVLNVVLGSGTLPSGRELLLTAGDLLLVGGVLMLWLETFKATRTSVDSIIDHTLSLLVFVVFLVEFLLVPRLGNTTFLILTVTSLVDVVMGFTVTISTARRDFAVGI